MFWDPPKLGQSCPEPRFTQIMKNTRNNGLFTKSGLEFGTKGANLDKEEDIWAQHPGPPHPRAGSPMKSQQDYEIVFKPVLGVQCMVRSLTPVQTPPNQQDKSAEFAGGSPPTRIIGCTSLNVSSPQKTYQTACPIPDLCTLQEGKHNQGKE